MATMLARTPMDATMKSRTPSTMNSKESLNIIFTEKKIRKFCYLKRILINLHTFHFLTFKVFLLDSLRQIQNDYKFKTKYVQT